MYKLICMTFDGNYVTERPEFETIAGAWRHAEDMGSRWYFYPFHFVTTEMGKTIADACPPLDTLKGKRVETVRRMFADLAKQPEMADANAETFAYSLLYPTVG